MDVGKQEENAVKCKHRLLLEQGEQSEDAGVGLILQESINFETKELVDNWGYPGIILSTVHL